MTRRVPYTNAKRHHIIPESYMLRFSNDGRRVHVFDRKSRKIRLDVPKNIAVEREFNTVIMKDGVRERWPEARLAEVDGTVGPCFDKLERGELLTCEERWNVSFFIGFAETRGSGFRESIRTRSFGGIEPESRFVDQRFARAFSAMTGVWLDVSTIERLICEDVAHVASGIEEIGGMVEAAFEVAQHVFWMHWIVCVTLPGCFFVTSDRPLGLWRPENGFGHDPLESDTIKVFLISATTALFIGNLTDTPTLMRETAAEELVRLANISLVRRCDRYVVGPSDIVVRTAVTDAKLEGEKAV